MPESQSNQRTLGYYNKDLNKFIVTENEASGMLRNRTQIWVINHCRTSHSARVIAPLGGKQAHSYTRSHLARTGSQAEHILQWKKEIRKTKSSRLFKLLSFVELGKSRGGTRLSTLSPLLLRCFSQLYLPFFHPHDYQL